MKRPYSAHLIPDVGDTTTTRNFHDAIGCMAHARCEARAMLKKHPQVDQIELVVVEYKAAVMFDLIGRAM